MIKNIFSKVYICDGFFHLFLIKGSKQGKRVNLMGNFETTFPLIDIKHKKI